MSSYKDFNGGLVCQARDRAKGLGTNIGKQENFPSTFPNEFRSSMSEYQNAIVFGNKNFQNIVEDFQNEIDKSMKEIDDYLDRAKKAQVDIESCMNQDIEANKAAIKAYNDFMLYNKADYETKVYVPSSNNYRTDYDEDAHVAAAEEAAQAVWEEQRCDLWG